MMENRTGPEQTLRAQDGARYYRVERVFQGVHTAEHMLGNLVRAHS